VKELSMGVKRPMCHKHDVISKEWQPAGTVDHQVNASTQTPLTCISWISFTQKPHDQIQEQPAKQGRSVNGEKIWIKHNNNRSRTTVKFECENGEDIYTL